MSKSTSIKGGRTDNQANRRKPSDSRPGSKGIRIFVYGTLLRGEHNHQLLDDNDLIGQATTKPTFTLIDLGAFPAMLRGGHTSVRGEVYEIAPVTLAALDRLEGHPRFYRRQPITLDDGQEVLTYLLPTNRALGHPTIHSGDWRSVSTAANSDSSPASSQET